MIVVEIHLDEYGEPYVDSFINNHRYSEFMKVESWVDQTEFWNDLRTLLLSVWNEIDDNKFPWKVRFAPECYRVISHRTLNMAKSLINKELRDLATWLKAQHIEVISDE